MGHAMHKYTAYIFLFKGIVRFESIIPVSFPIFQTSPYLPVFLPVLNYLFPPSFALN